MTSEEDLTVVRRAYAKQIVAAASVGDQRIEDAFAAVRREAYLGPGPWQVFRFLRQYVPTPNADPVYLYADDLVGIDPQRRINNGQPSLHAYLISKAAPGIGDHVVHVGAGVGYYTAIMAQLVGPTGRITAIEFEPDLALRLRENVARFQNATVMEGDGSALAFDPADVIYVNAGATRPAECWLDGLRDGGRLILPLTTDEGFPTVASSPQSLDPASFQRRGAVFLIRRQGADFIARWISPVAIYPAAGARDPVSEKALAEAFKKDDWRRVTRLYRSDELPIERCWLRAPGWSLAYE